MDYEKLVQEGLRHVVRRSLEKIRDQGLEASQSVCISFSLRTEGVQVPDYLRQVGGDQITISLEKDYTGLSILEDGFRVSLNFGERWHEIFVPFASLTGYLDPFYQFGLELSPDIDFEKEAPEEEEGKGGQPDLSNVISFERFRKK